MGAVLRRGLALALPDATTKPAVADFRYLHGAGHDNDAVDSAEEPVEIHAETRQIMSADDFFFIDESIPDQGQVQYPGIAHFIDPDLMKQWFKRTDEDQ